MDPRLLNKEWRLKNLYKIRNKQKEVITFARNKAQRTFHEQKHTRNIILKARQLGFTTDALITRLDKTLFERNQECIVVFQNQDVSRKKFEEVPKFAFDSIPQEIKEETGWATSADKAEQLSIELPKTAESAKSVSTLVTAIQGRGSTPSSIHISEFAKICATEPAKAQELMSGLITAAPRTAEVDIESTAEGVAGYFHDMFWEAWSGDNNPTDPLEFKAHFFNWRYEESIDLVTPLPTEELPTEFQEYQKKHNLTDKEITWYYSMWKNVSRKDWQIHKREFPTTPEEAFEVSGDKYFDMKAIQALKPDQEKPIRVKGNWKYYEEPADHHTYAMGADVAEGIGRDASTAVIMRFTTEEKNEEKKRPKVVATYVNDSIEPDKFGEELFRESQLWNDCVIAPERNNHGYTTCVKIRELGGNIYTEIKEDKRTKKRTEKMGWYTSGTAHNGTKVKMLTRVRSATIEDEFVIPDKTLQYELLMYPRDYVNKRQNDRTITKHFDLLIAFCICVQMENVVSYKRPKTSGGESSFLITPKQPGTYVPPKKYDSKLDQLERRQKLRQSGANRDPLSVL